MVIKELIDTRWKVIIGGLVVLVATIFLAASYNFFKPLQPANNAPPSYIGGQVQQSLSSYDAYAWSQWFGGNGKMILVVLAAIMGASLVAGEVSKGTIFILLSRPMGRARVLLIKYAVSAAVLLGIIGVSSVALLVTAAVIGHPQQIGGVLISTVLLWLGMLFVMGAAMLFSVLFRDVLKPVMGALLITIVLAVPSFIPDWHDWSLPVYWSSKEAFLGTAFPTKALMISLVVAVLPVLLALPLFRKQAY